jgi:AAA15 family ATPase/GTPase
MHPYLCEHLVNWFYETETNAQLIFTTHHTEFLDRKKIRPDQIWLTLRNMQDYTQIRPLSDFEIPEGVAYDRLYLQGIVGGVPHLSVLKPVESHDE